MSDFITAEKWRSNQIWNVVEVKEKTAKTTGERQARCAETLDSTSERLNILDVGKDLEDVGWNDVYHRALNNQVQDISVGFAFHVIALNQYVVERAGEVEIDVSQDACILNEREDWKNFE